MGILVLLRHGESVWNAENRFTGWTDVELSERGEEEARRAARRIAAYRPDAAFSSKLRRARRTLEIIMRENGWEGRTEASEALNARNYGELQGLNKGETAEKYGAEVVEGWRRSYGERPPGGESLEDTARRVGKYFRSEILPLVRGGGTALVVGHGNSLRAAVMLLEGLSPEEVRTVEIPTGTPIVYRIGEHGRIESKEVLRGGEEE